MTSNKKIATSWRLGICAVALAFSAGLWIQFQPPAFAQASNTVRIDVVAKRYEFGPGEIKVKKGQRVTIVLTSPDFVHGFSLPDFGVRADGVPGKTIEVTFVADKAGKFIYLCDNFCGEGHDRMSGFLIVTET
jgi:cytochrome c oxidase subunit II